MEYPKIKYAVLNLSLQLDVCWSFIVKEGTERLQESFLGMKEVRCMSMLTNVLPVVVIVREMLLERELDLVAECPRNRQITTGGINLLPVESGAKQSAEWSGYPSIKSECHVRDVRVALAPNRCYICRTFWCRCRRTTCNSTDSTNKNLSYIHLHTYVYSILVMYVNPKDLDWCRVVYYLDIYDRFLNWWVTKVKHYSDEIIFDLLKFTDSLWLFYKLNFYLNTRTLSLRIVTNMESMGPECLIGYGNWNNY